MILSIGGYIDSAFKEMARYPEFSENPDCQLILQKANERKSKIDPSSKAFEDIYGISEKRIFFKRIPDREIVVPFSRPNEEKRIPQWWFFYNDLKHDFSFKLEEANLENTRDALAGAFLLNVIHLPSVSRLCNYHLVKYNFGKMTAADCSSLLEMLEKKREYAAHIETPIFKYDYEQSRCSI
jgi:hypothetical protein